MLRNYQKTAIEQIETSQHKTLCCAWQLVLEKLIRSVN